MDGPRGSSNSPPPFLIKTYEMVDDPTTNSIVSWSPTNTSFVVWNQPEFARDLLPKYFKHNNFSSFVRQLNTYGFRKIDPEQWEFANEDFVRGQKHLLKTIHRRKPVHSHSLQIQGNSSVPLSEAERQELEEEIERLKQEKVSLVNELKKHAQQQQHGMEQQMESLEKRLQVIENRQRCLMAFLTQIIQGPGFLSNLVQHSDLHSKKRRLPKIDYFNEDTSMEDNQIVAFQPMATGTSDIVSMHTLDMEPFEKMESSLNSLEKFFRGVSEAAGDDMSYDSTVPCLPSDIILPEMNASSGDIDANLESLLPNLRPSSSCHRDIHSSPEVAECTSYVETPAIPAMENQTDSSSKVSETDANPKLLLPNLHPSSPCLRDIHSSPEVAECTSYVETPAIAATENQTDSRSKVSEIDMNIEPAATEVDSSRDQTTGTTASTVPAGVNDVFWEQFLTEIPGSSDMQEVQSKRRDSDDKQSEGKKGEWENTWWKWKKVYHLAEKMGNLTSVEKI